jgi:hypothetical protein
MKKIFYGFLIILLIMGMVVIDVPVYAYQETDIGYIENITSQNWTFTNQTVSLYYANGTLAYYSDIPVMNVQSNVTGFDLILQLEIVIACALMLLVFMAIANNVYRLIRFLKTKRRW